MRNSELLKGRVPQEHSGRAAQCTPVIEGSLGCVLTGRQKQGIRSHRRLGASTGMGPGSEPPLRACEEAVLNPLISFESPVSYSCMWSSVCARVRAECLWL